MSELKSDKAIVHHVPGFPGATVWADKDEPEVFYLTNSRGKNRSTQKLEATTAERALREAKDWLS